MRTQREDSTEHAPVDGRRPAGPTNRPLGQHAFSRRRIRAGAWRNQPVRGRFVASIALQRRQLVIHGGLDGSGALRLPTEAVTDPRGLPQRAREVRACL